MMKRKLGDSVNKIMMVLFLSFLFISSFSVTPSVYSSFSWNFDWEKDA